MRKTRKGKKYFNQLFVTYSVAFLLFFSLLFVTVLGGIYREQYSRNVDVQHQLISKIQSKLDSSLSGMDRILTGLLFNRSFIDMMADSKNTAVLPEYDSRMMNYFLTLDAPDLSTYRTIAFNDDTYYTLTKSDENPSYIKKSAETYPWKEQVCQADGEKVILPVHKDSFSSQGALVYSIARLVTDGFHNYGIVEVQNEYKNIALACSIENISGQILLFSSDGTQIYPETSHETTRSKNLSRDIFQLVSEEKISEGSLQKNRAQITYITSPYSEWTAVMYCPVMDVVPWGLQMILFSILAFVSLIAIVLILFRILTKRMVAPLNELSESLNDVSLENLSLELGQQYNIEEIDNINHSFQRMFEHLKHAINVSVQSKTNEERANYLALQSQMNPHTIYNTISMIEGVAYMNDDFEVSELCIRFSKMLRYLSDFSRDTYTILDEVSHLENYAFLVQKRYDGKLKIQISVQEGLDAEIIPKFTLQPLAENCVKHGFRSSNDRFVVNVTVSGDSASWHIKISDNGSGFTTKSLETISKQLKECDAGLKTQKDLINRKIGNLTISNIYIRFCILYGERFRFHYGNNHDAPGAYIDLKVLWNAKAAKGEEYD